MYHANKCTDPNNVPCVFMATKYPITKHKAFFQKKIISANK